MTDKSPSPLAITPVEQKSALAEMNAQFSPAETARKLISIENDAAEAKANLSAVEPIEQEIANEKDSREKYEAAQQRLAELKSQALKQVDLGTF